MGIPTAVPATASNAADRFAFAARHAGCPRDQAENFFRAQTALQPKQLRASAMARLCDRPDGPQRVGYGGARGGGKSHWALCQMGADDCQRQAGLKCLLLRKVGKAAREGFEDLRLRVFRHLPHTYNRQEGVLTFPNGSRIIIGHFKDEKDIDAYLGLEYDVVAIEEATTLTSSKRKAILTCLRTSKPDWRPRVYSTTNPGGVGHAWYKAEFIVPYQRRRETETRFVPATIDDNRFLNPEYRGNLETLTGWMLRAWRYGDWDIAAGQFFTTFRAEIDGRPHHVIPAFEIPSAWRKWGAMDYGFTHYTVFHLFAEDGDGNVYVVDEHAERQWLPQRHAIAIKSLLARHGLTVEYLWKIVAGADVFAKRGLKEDEPQTIADTYQSLGIPLDPANDDRINGAGEMLIRLGDVEAKDEDGRPAPIPPRLFIFDRCARLAETLPALEHDPHRPEDVLKVDVDEDGIGGDDAYDCARYGTMVVYRPRLLESRPDLHEWFWNRGEQGVDPELQALGVR